MTVEVAVPPSLRFLLPGRDRTAGLRRLPHDPDATVGHLVQAAGVPLTEVGGLTVDGNPARAGDRPRPGSRIEVTEAARPEPVPSGGSCSMSAWAPWPAGCGCSDWTPPGRATPTIPTWSPAR